MRAATIHVDTEGIGFDVTAQVGTIGGEGREVTANAATIAGALRQLADKLEVIAQGQPLADDLLQRITEFLHSPGGLNGYDTIKKVKAMIEGDVLDGGA